MNIAPRISFLAVTMFSFSTVCAAGLGELSQDSAILAVSDAERILLEPTLNDAYFKRGLPPRHLRHRLVRIDTKQLEVQLQNDWESRQAAEEATGVFLPLFDDLTVLLKVSQVINNDAHGVTAFFGGIETDDQPTSRFNVMIWGDGRLKAVVHANHVSYMIEHIRDFEYYVVMSLKSVDMDMD